MVAQKKSVFKLFILTFLIIKNYHEDFKHQNKSLVINQISKFWILSIKGQLNKVITKCQHCKIVNLKYEAPIMSPLPEDTTQEYVKPFSYSRIDYCGPFLVKVKKNNRKKVDYYIQLPNNTGISIRSSWKFDGRHFSPQSK